MPTMLVIHDTQSPENALSQVVTQLSISSKVMIDLYTTTKEDSKWYLELHVISEVLFVKAQLKELTKIPFNPTSIIISSPKEFVIQSLENELVNDAFTRSRTPFVICDEPYEEERELPC